MQLNFSWLRLGTESPPGSGCDAAHPWNTFAAGRAGLWIGNRMQALADKRADPDLQVSLLAEHEVTRLVQLVTLMAE